MLEQWNLLITFLICHIFTLCGTFWKNSVEQTACLIYSLMVSLQLMAICYYSKISQYVVCHNGYNGKRQETSARPFNENGACVTCHLGTKALEPCCELTSLPEHCAVYLCILCACVHFYCPEADTSVLLSFVRCVCVWYTELLHLLYLN